MVKHRCVICGVTRDSKSVRRTWKHRSQMGLLLASLMYAENLTLEKAKNVFSSCLMSIHGKHLCHRHYKNAASWLIGEARRALDDPNQLEAHLRVALEPAHPHRVDVVSGEVLRRLQHHADSLDRNTLIVMLDIVRFLSDCTSRYGLNNIIMEVDMDPSDSSKRKLDSEETVPEYSKHRRFGTSGEASNIRTELEAALFAVMSCGSIEKVESDSKTETDSSFFTLSDFASIDASGTSDGEDLKNKIFCVEEEKLKQLFHFCPRCGSNLKEGESSVNIRAVGTAPVVTVRCNNCSRSSKKELVWFGQHKAVDHPKALAFSNNIRIAIAALTSGVRMHSILRLANETNQASLSKSTFCRVFQRLQPAIHKVYSRHQIDVFQRVKAAYENDHLYGGWNIAVNCAYDACSMCVPICKVQAVDLKTGLFLHAEVLQSSERDSTTCCKEGLRRIMRRFADRNIRICSVSTDTVPSFDRAIAEINRELSWEMQWYIDPWHLGRRLAKKIQEASRSRAYRVLSDWIKTLRAHVMYTASIGSETADARNIKFIFNTCLYHVAGVHKWEQDEMTGPLTECGHGTLEYDIREAVPFGSLAHEKLKKIVLQPNFQKNLCKLSPHGCRNWIETKNALDHLYCPREIYLSPESYSVYMCMSSLHMNVFTTEEAKTGHSPQIQYPFQCTNDISTRMIHKTTIPHEWRREIAEEYLAEMKSTLNWASAEDEESLYVAHMDRDKEELYSDMPLLLNDFEDAAGDIWDDNSDEDVDLTSEELLFSNDSGITVKREPIE